MNNLVAEHFDFRPPFTASNKNYFVRFACCLRMETIMFLTIIMSYARLYAMFTEAEKGFICHSGVAPVVPIDLYAFGGASHRASRAKQSTRNHSIGNGVVAAAAEYDMRCQHFTVNEMRYSWKLSLLVSLYASISPLAT